MPEPKTPDMTNNKMSRFLSNEIIFSLFVMSAAVGGSFAVTASDQTRLSTELKNVKDEQTVIQKDIAKIQTDTALIANEQGHIKEDIKSILKLLEKPVTTP